MCFCTSQLGAAVFSTHGEVTAQRQAIGATIHSPLPSLRTARLSEWGISASPEVAREGTTGTKHFEFLMGGIPFYCPDIADLMHQLVVLFSLFAAPNLVAPMGGNRYVSGHPARRSQYGRAGLRCAPARSQRQADGWEPEKKSLVELQGRPCSTCRKPETVEVLCLLTATASAEQTQHPRDPPPIMAWLDSSHGPLERHVCKDGIRRGAKQGQS